VIGSDVGRAAHTALFRLRTRFLALLESEAFFTVSVIVVGTLPVVC
jgi:hypothetical protein